MSANIRRSLMAAAHRRNSGVADAVTAALFADGSKGFWYDPTDVTTLFQDSSGQNPITLAGQTVRRVVDKSGNGNDLILPEAYDAPYWGIDSLFHYGQRAMGTEFPVDCGTNAYEALIVWGEKRMTYGGSNNPYSSTVFDYRNGDSNSGFVLYSSGGVFQQEEAYVILNNAGQYTGERRAWRVLGDEGDKEVRSFYFDINQPATQEFVHSRVNGAQVARSSLITSGNPATPFPNCHFHLGREYTLSRHFIGYTYGLVCVFKPVSLVTIQAVEAEMNLKVNAF